MIAYNFQVTCDVDGQSEQRPFSITAKTLADAVSKSLQQMIQEQPQAQFKGLTYFHPPLEPRSYK
jgi:hypothetical protein